MVKGVTLAVTGKGGTGKTTVSALLVGELVRRGLRPVLAVDADPNASLAGALGVSSGPTLSEIREKVKSGSISSTTPKAIVTEQMLQEAVQESRGFDLLAMGRPEGPGCYCYVNNLLRHSLKELGGNYRFMVIDNEAGMEHVSRMTVSDIHCLYLVCEPTPASLRTAARISALAESLPVSVARKVLVVNKCRGAMTPALQEMVSGLGLPEAVELPYSERVASLEESAQALIGAEQDGVPRVDELLSAGGVIP